MSDPTREELIEATARALCSYMELDPDVLMPLPPLPDGTPQHIIRWRLHEKEATAILDAILPRVLEGVVAVMDDFVPWEGGLEECGCDECSKVQRARSTRQWAEKRISECPPSTTK